MYDLSFENSSHVGILLRPFIGDVQNDHGSNDENANSIYYSDAKQVSNPAKTLQGVCAMHGHDQATF